MGATMAFLAAIEGRKNGKKIYTLLDYQAAVKALQTVRIYSCLKLSRVFHIVIKKANADVVARS